MQTERDGKKITDIFLFIFKFQVSLFFSVCNGTEKWAEKGLDLPVGCKLWRNEKKLSLFHGSGENALSFLSAKPLSCPLPTVVSVLGILLVPWGTIFGMLQLPCGTIFLPLNQENWGVVGVPGENKSWKDLHFFHWKFSMEERDF